MSDGLSITRLDSFLEVVEAGSFARAAPDNPVRQSQMSRQVGELETYFGRPLLERRGRGIAVTAAGRRLAAVVRELKKGFEDVRREETDATLPFTFGAGDSLLQWFVIPRIAEVSRHVPHACPSLVSLASADVVAELLEGRLDFGLVRAKEVPRALASKPLLSLEYALYVPRKLRARAPSEDVAALLSRVPLALQSSEPELNARILAIGQNVGAALPALKCETFPQACSAVRSGRYAALLPTIVESELPAREVVEVALPGLGRFSAKLYLAWHPRTTLRRAGFERLAAVLQECLRREDD
jgi:DNA-binding transcriptional LysR family regulator